jgi:hypothetical protein
MATTYTQALLDRATAYIGQPLSARRYDEGLAEVTALYSEITGQPAAKCRQCQYSNYLAVVQAYIRQATRELHPDTMADSKYTLAPGYENETFVHESLSQAVTGESLTDQTAEFLIAKGFGHAIVLKSGQSASTEGDATTEVETENPLVPQADLEKEQEAHRATAKRLEEAQATHTADKTKASEALKAEQKAHQATKKELTSVSGKLGQVEKALAEAQATIEGLRTPAAPAETSPVPLA